MVRQVTKDDYGRLFRVIPNLKAYSIQDINYDMSYISIDKDIINWVFLVSLKGEIPKEYEEQSNNYISKYGDDDDIFAPLYLDYKFYELIYIYTKDKSVWNELYDNFTDVLSHYDDVYLYQEYDKSKEELYEELGLYDPSQMVLEEWQDGVLIERTVKGEQRWECDCEYYSSMPFEEEKAKRKKRLKATE